MEIYTNPASTTPIAAVATARFCHGIDATFCKAVPILPSNLENCSNIEAVAKVCEILPDIPLTCLAANPKATITAPTPAQAAAKFFHGIVDSF